MIYAGNLIDRLLTISGPILEHASRARSRGGGGGGKAGHSPRAQEFRGDEAAVFFV